MTHRRKQLVIEKFVKPPINWPNEMRLLGQILQAYPLEFLEFLVLGYQIKTLLFFRYDNIQSIIKKEIKKFNEIQGKEKTPIVFNDKPFERRSKKKDSLKKKLGI